MKKYISIILFLNFAFFATPLSANISTQNIPKPLNFIQSANLVSFFNILGSGFFLTLDITIPKEITSTTKPLIPITNQTIWIMDDEWVATPVQSGNSIITLAPMN